MRKSKNDEFYVRITDEKDNFFKLIYLYHSPIVQRRNSFSVPVLLYLLNLFGSVHRTCFEILTERNRV